MQLGGMIGRRFALLGGLEWGGQGGHAVFSLHAFGRYFLAPRAWFDGGVGLGTISLAEGNQYDTQFNGVAYQIAGGYDIFQGAAFAFDASLRSMLVRGKVVGGDRGRDDLVF